MAPKKRNMDTARRRPSHQPRQYARGGGEPRDSVGDDEPWWFELPIEKIREDDQDWEVERARHLASIMKAFEYRRFMCGIRDIGAIPGVDKDTAKSLWHGDTWPDFLTLAVVGDALGAALTVELPSHEIDVPSNLPQRAQEVLRMFNKMGRQWQELFMRLLRAMYEMARKS